MRNIIFIAPPAAGKGTQSKLVSEEYNIPHISTGDLLREEIAKETELGKSIKEDMEKGNLVSDEVITTLLKNRITYLNYENSTVIFFDIDKDRALKRTISRIICPNCGSSYNLLVDELKPHKENICDRCHHELKTRKDDTEEVFKNRFDTYINSTKELIDYYNNLNMLHKIEVLDKSANTIFEEVKKVLND